MSKARSINAAPCCTARCSRRNSGLHRTSTQAPQPPIALRRTFGIRPQNGQGFNLISSIVISFPPGFPRAYRLFSFFQKSPLQSNPCKFIGQRPFPELLCNPVCIVPLNAFRHQQFYKTFSCHWSLLTVSISRRLNHFRDLAKMVYPHCSAIAAAIPGLLT